MRRPATLLLLITTALPCIAAEEATEKASTPAGIAFFEKNIRPLLVDRCQECHSASEPESGLNLESRKGMLKGGELGPAIVPGKPKESLLIKAVNHAEYLRMPPKDKLATKELMNLAKWVKMGAPWPSEDDESETTEIQVEDNGTATFTKEQREFWAFQPPVRPNVPAVKNKQWLQSPIDNFVLSRLESAELKPAPTSDKRTLLRRAAYDLTGLPPSQKTIEDFLADDSDSAFANVIDHLLATPQYGERWGRHWLDVARYADTNGLDENMAYAHAWRYRDYVIDAFNNDKPYDRFVQEQIAGDLLAPDPDALHDNGRFVATGFLAIGAKMLAEDDPMKMQMDIVDEQLNTVCQAFMGLTIGCCRCHDHKFDPLPAADYYSLAGIFKSSKTMEHHNVVAQWYNRKLSVPEIDEQIKQVDERLAENKKLLDQIDQAAREIKASHVREHFGDYLLAAAELATFDSKMSPAPKNPPEPYQIVDGYLRIEAEAFHRGNIQKTREGYGEGIGVVLSSGAAFLEYDVHADRAGTYELELRYAAEDSRPFKIRVNGKQVAKKAGGEITGSWNPDGQQWFRETKFELKEGKNTIRFQSNKVFPHIDKLSIAYSIADGETWPFTNPRPLSVRQIVEQRDLHLDVVREWSSFLSKIDNGELHHRAFVPWVRLRDFPAGDFAEKVADIATADETIPAIRMCLAKTDPQSVSDLADAYQTLLASVDEKVFNPNPKQPSPLHSADHVAWFGNDEQNSRRDELNANAMKSRRHALQNTSPSALPKLSLKI